MFSKTKKVLVVGHKGFIGSHIMEIKDSKIELSGMDIVDGKINDVKGDAWYEKKYDAIVFLACNFEESGVGYTDNVQMLSSLEEYLKTYPKTHIIYTSSAAVYPDLYHAMRENDVHQNGSPTLYGQGKLVGEMLLATYNATILRLSNVVGPRGRGVVQLFENGERHIYGSGQQVRDFIHVSEVVRTVHDAILHPKKWQGVYNVSTGFGTTINHIYKLVGKGSPIWTKARKGDVKFSVLDNAKWVNQWLQK